MPLVSPTTLKDSYDVIVVGSGAGGGQAAYTLTLEGAKVLMLEAGVNYDPVTQTPMFQTPHQAPLRGSDTPEMQGGFFDATRGGGWKIKDEPYTTVSDKDGENFEWWRSRMLGGRTNHWGRYSFRNGPYDFKPYTRDGLGFDWPISYSDLAPYYDKVEMLIGVYGTNEGLENTPDSSPDCLLPPPKPRVSDLLIQKAAKAFGIPVVAGHRAVLTQRLDFANLPARLHPGNAFAQRIVREAMEARAACFWATDCGRGCSIKANYQSTTVHLPPALASGNLDILPNAMAREITLGRDGTANGVSFVDKTTGQDRQIKARVVVVAASAMESVRLLLNSRSGQFPQGLGNSSGLLGKYIMDTVGSGVRAQIPRLENVPPHNEDGASGGHMYAPWWLYKEQLAGKLGFARGYHIEFGGGRRMPELYSMAAKEWLTGGSYGKKFKEDARRYYGSFVGFNGRGEMIPNEGSYCELDPVVKDKWGIPALRFHWKFSEHETRQAAHMQKTFGEIVSAMGGRLRHPVKADGADAIQNGGSVIHEVGGAIMGADPAKSVTNKWSQTHDVKNVFLTDGAPFASNADKNPTLTIMALSWRAADRIASEMKKGNL
ncbi:MAG: oxidoreductase family protein [Verrucomicrobia bacterium]|nr:oxidoreductase family protein [Verrucomicrobiota bacterium]